MNLTKTGRKRIWGKEMALLLSPLLIVSSVEADVWYVKAANYGQNGLDGRSEATAWGTLQEAHDNASAGDTVYVLPGDYDQGGATDTTSTITYATGSGAYTSNNNHPNRLLVSKKLTFESTVDKAAHIVGIHAATADGRGSGAVRCITVMKTGWGTVFKNFTIRDGATLASGGDPTGGANGITVAAGGGLLVYGERGPDKTKDVRRVYLVDCVISNCVSVWGGAMHGGTAIRCLLKDNVGSSFGGAACHASLWNTVIVGNRSLASARPVLGNYTRAVNCTLSGCMDIGAQRSTFLWNCVFVNQESTEMATGTNLSAYYPSAYTNCYGKADDAYPLISPATGDFRPRAGSPIVGGGVTADLTEQVDLPAGTAMTDFNGNPLDLTKPACDAGAVQGAVAPRGGRLDFAEAAEVNGYRNRRTSYSYATEWPAAVRLRPLVDRFFRVRLGGFTANGSPFRYADYNGFVQMLYPPFDNTATTVAQDTYDYELWCSPTADAETADGTAGHPFRTLQAAMYCLTNSQYAGKNSIVRALPGDYREGSVRNFGHQNRLSIPAARPVLIKSTGGAAVTTIWGESDPDTVNDDVYPGCGPNAMRCAVFDGTTTSASSRAIQGFTLADGHSNKEDYTGDKTGDRVGGIYAGGEANAMANQILDCVFTNCAAVRGGAAYFGWHSRCRYYDCHGYGGVTRYASLSACYVDPSCTLGAAPADANRNAVLGTDTRVYFSTCPTASYLTSVGAGRHFCNLYGTQDASGNCRFWGSIFKTAAYVNPQTQGVTIADPQFVDPDGGDYRVSGTSPALAGGRLPEVDTAEWGIFATNIWTFASSDVNARPLRATAGKLMAGCDHEPVRGLYVEATKGGLTLAGASLGFTGLTDGLSVSVSPGTGSRPCIGYVVNGTATNLFREVASGTVTAADATGDGLLIAALYSTDWYVNADKSVGDDAKTGFMATVPKRTLAAALANARAGDTVHVAAGTYDEGSATPSGWTIAARALVPAGVTLEGAGAEETFIVGARASAANADTYGRGADAVRCVYLDKGAVVRGFTLTGGATKSGWSDSNAVKTDWHGAGVCGAAMEAADVAATRVEDCIVSNCVAVCGGAGYGATFVRSRLFKCRAVRGSATEQCGLVNTIADDMDSDSGAGICVNNSYPIINSTIGPSIRRDGGTGAALFYQPNLFPVEHGVVNTVILGTVSYVTAMTNCVYLASTTSDARVRCRTLTAAAIALGVDYRPDRAASALVDQGTADAAYGETDVYGGQRIYNGTVDIGAVEADWRGQYAADLNARKSFEVTEASPDVVETEAGAVRLAAGETLAAQWNGAGARRHYSLALHLAADSAVTVTLNGVSTTYDTAGLHEFKFDGADSLQSAVQIACTAGTADLLAADVFVGTAISIR